VSPFALHQLSPQPSADDSACAKSGNGLMGAKSGNNSVSVSCESLRAWASQPCVSLEARSCGLDPGSSGCGKDQPAMVCQKASTEIAMKREVPNVCCNHIGSQMQAAGQGFFQLPLPKLPLALAPIPAITEHPVDLLDPSPEPMPLCPSPAPGDIFTGPTPLQLVATPSLTSV